MWRGLAVGLLLLLAIACDRLSDPATLAISRKPDEFVDVTSSLPKGRDEALRMLAGWGYAIKPSLKETSAAIESGISLEEFFNRLPVVERPPGVQERIYLLRRFEDRDGGEGYAVVVDVDGNGRVLAVTALRSYVLFY